MELQGQFGNSYRLIAEYDSDYEKLRKLKRDTTYKIVITEPRNPKRHKMFFALVNMVLENQEKYDNIDDLREQLTIKAGYYRVIETIDGEREMRALSISFARMDDIKFNEYYKAVWDVVARWLDISDEDIQRELINFM